MDELDRVKESLAKKSFAHLWQSVATRFNRTHVVGGVDFIVATVMNLVKCLLYLHLARAKNAAHIRCLKIHAMKAALELCITQSFTDHQWAK